jgi:Family of unknown function (DUF5946)
MTIERANYDELCYYTLAHADPQFIHQHVVDAFQAQTADERTKAIALSFSLAGLYLPVERNFSGRQVQQAHVELGRRKQSWPTFDLPADRGAITVAGVVRAPARPKRDAAIHAWCAGVWAAFGASRLALLELLRQRGYA